MTIPNQQNLGQETIVEIEKLEAQLAAAKIPQELRDRVEQMISRVRRVARLGSYSQEFDFVQKYIDWITKIPWATYTPDNLSLENAKLILDQHHFGLQPIKDRLLEYLAVIKLKGGIVPTLQTAQTQVSGEVAPSTSDEMKKLQGSSTHAPVLCFVGIQGIGKTSMAKSIADALGRKFVRIALGGMSSVTELRGVPKGNPDSEPGQIVKALTRTGSMNPLILLDEIDKVSSDTGLRGDVMAALLEVLDPEQNSTFIDHYIDYPVDLSKIMFITTANNLGGITAALLDRLEVIRFSSYSDIEKQVIAKDYLLPKVREATGITEQQLSFADDVWPLIIRPLGFDAGVRQLERTLTTLARKVAKLIVEGKATGVQITVENFRQFIPDDIGVYS